MLPIPFIDEYIEKVVKKQPVADSVDWLNYFVTSLLLALFSVAISAKQYFGKPIQCWVPSEFHNGWEEYAQDYCFIANSYHVPWEEDIPKEHARQDHISYYRWVPIMLALQAVCFFLPNWLWNMLHEQTAVNPRAIVSETMKCKDLYGEERRKEVKNVAEYIHETLQIFKQKDASVCTGWNATILYLATKFCFLFNVVLQFYMMNHFLGGTYVSWGWETIQDLFRGNEWVESPIFPRVILCDFEVRRLANRQRHTVQCVIMMNMINEKLYLFLYVWFIFIGIATAINFLYNVAVFTIPGMKRAIFVASISKNDISKSGGSNRDVSKFVSHCLCSDGVLLLQFIRQNVGGRVTRDIVQGLFELYLREKNDMYLTEEYSPESLRAGKRPSKINYGPSSLYPAIEERDNAKRTSSAPPSDDVHSYDDGTLPIGAGQNVIGNFYTTSHVADV